MTRELDAEVAEKVMGCKVREDTDSLEPVCTCWPPVHANKIRHMELEQYTADVAAAFTVVDKLREDHNLIWAATSNRFGGILFQFFRADTTELVGEATDETLPLAICRAALEAIRRLKK